MAAARVADRGNVRRRGHFAFNFEGSSDPERITSHHPTEAHVAALPDYATKYSCARLRREAGILEITLHTDGDSMVWGEVPHRELPDLFYDVSTDPGNRVVILTGAGDDFCPAIDVSTWPEAHTTAGWSKIYREGKHLLQNLLAIEAPMIGAINGAARAHAELGVLCDVVLADDTAVLQDTHFSSNVVPADGVHIVWPRLLGPNRGRYFLLCGQELSAGEALTLGVVSEVVPPEDLLDRAWEIARQMAEMAPLTLLHTRAALTQDWKRAILNDLGYGLILEGAALASVSSASV
jgi:enoyl-CoA hydratase/carnithine racemase